jgi:hypothetical protein
LRIVTIQNRNNTSLDFAILKVGMNRNKRYNQREEESEKKKKSVESE